MGKLTLATQRSYALSAIKVEIRTLQRQCEGMEFEGKPVRCPQLETTSFDEALTILDEISRREPNYVASRWYTNVNEYQLTLFKRDWNRMQRQLKRQAIEDAQIARILAKTK